MLRNPGSVRIFTSLVCTLALALTTAVIVPAAAASEEDDSDLPFHDLDSVDTGEMHDLDGVDTGHTETLDSVETGKTHSLDSADTGHTESLDSVDIGHTESLDRVDTGHTETLDSVVERAYEHDAVPAARAPTPLPAIEDGNWEAQAKRSKAIIAAAEKRLSAANRTYGDMIRHDYPRGEARVQIIAERDAAERDLNDAWSYYGQIKKRATGAGRPF
jgi:hypothetical protein